MAIAVLLATIYLTIANIHGSGHCLNTTTGVYSHSKIEKQGRELALQAERKVCPSTEYLIWVMPT